MRAHFAKHVAIPAKEAVQAIKERAIPLEKKEDLEPLFRRIGKARIVMLGEASHGTHEYYTWRKYISQKLIEEMGFNFIAVEGDWPDCYRLNRYVKGFDSGHGNPREVLNDFNRWPTWMWANWEIVALASWLKDYNRNLAGRKKAGFYGLDVYSLWESMESIMQYLERNDPKAFETAQEAFRCFAPYRAEEGRSYARASQLVPELCQDEVVQLLREIRKKISSYNSDAENVFSTEQNALISVNAERYYRAMVMGGPHSWNLRDRHMADTLQRLLDFHGPDSKAIVWAHNTHIGDARATDMVDDGMFNIGEIARLEHHDTGVVLVGFGSYTGSVIAGKSWGASMQAMPLPRALEGSWEHILHEAGHNDKLVMMDDLVHNDIFMENHFGHRAVGVVYRPKYEQYGNYVPSILPLRYDAFIHIDETRALYPLHLRPDGHQIPETYPFGE